MGKNEIPCLISTVSKWGYFMDILRLFFSPKGRITRQPFIIGIVVLIVVAILLTLMMNGLNRPGNPQGDLTPMEGMLLFLAVVVGMGSLYSNICLTIKRFRDAGLTSWLTLLILIPYVNLAVTIFLMVYPSKNPDVPASPPVINKM